MIMMETERNSRIFTGRYLLCGDRLLLVFAAHLVYPQH